MEQLEMNISRAEQTIQTIIHSARERYAPHAVEASISPLLASGLYEMQQHVYVDPFRDIAWPHWPPGARAKLEAFLQKIIRHMLRWYIEPIVQQQNAFNQATLMTVRAALLEVQSLQTTSRQVQAEQQQRLMDLVAQLTTLEQTLQSG